MSAWPLCIQSIRLIVRTLLLVHLITVDLVDSCYAGNTALGQSSTSWQSVIDRGIGAQYTIFWHPWRTPLHAAVCAYILMHSCECCWLDVFRLLCQLRAGCCTLTANLKTVFRVNILCTNCKPGASQDTLLLAMRVEWRCELP
jgi:hypothetical protein